MTAPSGFTDVFLPNGGRLTFPGAVDDWPTVVLGDTVFFSCTTDDGREVRVNPAHVAYMETTS